VPDIDTLLQIISGLAGTRQELPLWWRRFLLEYNAAILLD
jgi:hypothetical protein